MNFKIVIRYKDATGAVQEESVSFTRQSRRDAELFRHFNEEAAGIKHGKNNVVAVELIETEASD